MGECFLVSFFDDREVERFLLFIRSVRVFLNSDGTISGR